MNDLHVVGQPIPSVDGIEKVTGAAAYYSDHRPPGMLYGAILRSPFPHARIRGIDVSKAKKLRGVRAVVTGESYAGIPYGVFTNSRDQFLLARDKVRYIGEEVAAVAATSQDVAQEALALISVDYEDLPAVFDFKKAMEPGAPQLHEHAPNNIGAENNTSYGDVDACWRRADYRRTETFFCEAISHVQMEPYGVLASYSGGKLLIWAPTTSPFARRRALSNVLDLPAQKIRVHKVFSGGAFGGRSETFPADYCAARLSIACGRPVRITLSREESLMMSRQKHPMEVTMGLALTKDGAILAKTLDLLADGGAYMSTGPIAIGWPLAMVEIALRSKSLRWRGRRIYTNRPIRGAMKGHGGQQVHYAESCLLDLCAKDLGIDPLDIRLRNAMKTGEEALSGSRVVSSGLSEALEACAGAVNWKTPKPSANGKLRGRGIGGAGMINGFNMGFRSSSSAYLKFNEDASLTLFTGAVDNGQGNNTMVVQVAAEALGVPVSSIELISADSETTPQDPGAYSMSATFVSGNGVRAAALDAREQLLALAAERLEANVADIEGYNGELWVRGAPQRRVGIGALVRHAYAVGRPVLGRGSYTPKINFNRDWLTPGKQYGQATGTYSYGAVTAEVEVDPETGEVTVLKVAAAQDCGKAINPRAVDGQVHGSVLFGIGQVFHEGFTWDGGMALNPNLLEYHIPTIKETPEIVSLIVESNDPDGPYGAKEAAEAAGLAVISALVNAVYDATGVMFTRLPISPADVVKALEAKQRQRRG
ncbi:MAG: molybdopterin-dependent oxidoreductase [Candidatus Tectomicrobia bacterium]|nr:molybdopterin-dependent oxidoreductase [Candidatus Tectomicrobia bacterium]